jgi:hypothetical protein
MQYILMVYVNEAGWFKLTQAEQEQGVAAYNAYTEALRKAGVLTGANRLQASSAATTVRVANGKAGAGWTLCGLERAAGRLRVTPTGQRWCSFRRPSVAGDGVGARRSTSALRMTARAA